MSISRLFLLQAAAFISTYVSFDPVHAGTPSDKSDYFQLIYDFEVAGYCGLITTPILDATRSKRDGIERESALSADDLRSIRIAAFVAADREYQNRSLGGHKAWCQSDGVDGVNRILGR